jgi:hypothetical protein
MDVILIRDMATIFTAVGLGYAASIAPKMLARSP